MAVSTASETAGSSSNTNGQQVITVGVLALQGAFREHATHINRLNAAGTLPVPVRSSLIRTPEQLAECDALIIPGGESTAISLGAERSGLLAPLRKWVREGKPVWGTCAGMIMLAREASGGKKGGQQLLGGVDVRVGRNGFGSQVDSFETPLHIKGIGADPFNGVSIRAPVVDSLLLTEDLERVAVDQPTDVSVAAVAAVAAASDVPSAQQSQPQPVRLVVAPPLSDETDPVAAARSRPPLEILASLPEPVMPNPRNNATTPPSATAASPSPSAVSVPDRPEFDNQIVALRQGKILVTSFHPELTTDTRLHELFVSKIVLGGKK